MSIEVMTLVWKKSHNRRTALLLLLAIADHAHDDGAGAYPSIRYLANKTRQSERNVQLLLNTLETSKELSILEGKGPHGCNAYKINLHLLENYGDWDARDMEGENDESTESSSENIAPRKDFTPEISRVENAEDFTGGMKISANSNSKNVENKLENATSPRQISPKPLTVIETSIEPSVDAFAKSQIQNEIQTHLKSLFYFPSDADWKWLDALCLEIPDDILLIAVADRMANLTGGRNFNQTEFCKTARFRHGRNQHERAFRQKVKI